jgi:ankyrin repeat protein
MYAVSNLHEGLVEFLTFDKKVNINAADVEGVTALLIAAEKGNIPPPCHTACKHLLIFRIQSS